MKTYIPKQPKHTRERIEAKLDTPLVRQLERYCEYLESDRDYVLSQVLELIFRKDKGFAEWLDTKKSTPPPEAAASLPPENGRRARIGGTQ
jgi:hypothetical protein